jgi:hypothetical protein
MGHLPLRQTLIQVWGGKVARQLFTRFATWFSRSGRGGACMESPLEASSLGGNLRVGWRVKREAGKR